MGNISSRNWSRTFSSPANKVWIPQHCIIVEQSFPYTKTCIWISQYLITSATAGDHARSTSHVSSARGFFPIPPGRGQERSMWDGATVPSEDFTVNLFSTIALLSTQLLECWWESHTEEHFCPVISGSARVWRTWWSVITALLATSNINVSIVQLCHTKDPPRLSSCSLQWPTQKEQYKFKNHNAFGRLF